MIKKTITYTDFMDEQHTEDFYFHLSKAELIELELGHMGGETFTDKLNKLSASQDGKEILAIFKDIVHRSIGKRSVDGRSFRKDPEYAAEFVASEAYSELFIEFMSNAAAFADFVNGLVPTDLREAVAKSLEERSEALGLTVEEKGQQIVSDLSREAQNEPPITRNVFEQPVQGDSGPEVSRRDLRDN